MAPTDPNETVSIRQKKSVKPNPARETPDQPGGDSSSPRRPPRQTASANPVSPDDLLAGQPFPEKESLVPLASAFAVGLVAGLIAGILISRD